MLPLLNIFCFRYIHTVFVLYCSHLCMKCSLGIINFLEAISSLCHSFFFFLSFLKKKLSIFFKLSFLILFYYYYYFYFTILYWFCHTSTCICHGCTHVPHPEPHSHLPPHTIPLGHPRAPAPSFLYNNGRIIALQNFVDFCQTST